MKKIITFIKEIRSELRHVNWPSRKETTWFTILVILVSLLIAYYLGLLDLIFTSLLELII